MELEELAEGPSRGVFIAYGTEFQLAQIETVLGYMNYLGDTGSTRSITISYDGDGSARMKFYRKDKDNKIEKIGSCIARVGMDQNWWKTQTLQDELDVILLESHLGSGYKYLATVDSDGNLEVFID